MIGNHWLAVQVFTDPDKIMLENFRVIEKKNILMGIFKFFFIFTTSVRYFVNRLLNDFDLYIFCKFPFDMYQSNAWWDYFENFLLCLLLYLCTSNFFEGGSKYIGYLKRGFDIMQDIFPNKGPLNSIIYSTTDHTTEHISCYLYLIDEISDSYQYLWRSIIMFYLQRK